MDKYNKIDKKLNYLRHFSIFYLLFISLIILPAASFIIEYILYLSINILLPEYSYLIMIAFLSPIIEEGGKIAAYNYFRSRNKLRDVLIILSIGFLFGLTENILFYFGAASDFTTAEVIHRVVNGEILHSVAPTFYLLNIKKPHGNFLSFSFPVTIHLIWNLLIYFELNTIFIYLFSLLLIIYLILKVKRL